MDHNWGNPEMEEWEANLMEEYDRQSTGFACSPFRFCFPRQYCLPRQYFCSPRKCSPNYACFPRR
jgi:hypothetical protein